MKTYNSRYGIITNSKLVLYPLNYQNISLSNIHAIKIIEKKSELTTILTRWV